MTNPARQYSTILYERIVRCMRHRHPLPCFSGHISLETLYSLNVIDDVLKLMEERGLVHRLTDDEKISMRLRVEYDVYVLTDAGYNSNFEK